MYMCLRLIQYTYYRVPSDDQGTQTLNALELCGHPRFRGIRVEGSLWVQLLFKGVLRNRNSTFDLQLGRRVVPIVLYIFTSILV